MQPLQLEGGRGPKFIFSFLKHSQRSKYPMFEVSGPSDHALIFFRTRGLKYWVLGRLGIGMQQLGGDSLLVAIEHLS